MADMLKGSVKWFNDAKGFGFIEHSNGEDVFVHYSVIEWDGFKTLKDGEEVEYELKAGEKGLHAARVTRPGAMQKKLDRLAAEKSAEVAPNLQSGSVESTYRSSSSMLEVEKVDAAENLSEDGAIELNEEPAVDTASEESKNTSID